MTRLKWIAAILFILIAYGFGYWLVFGREMPYERPRKLTAVEQATLADRVKGIGRHTVIVGNEVITIRMEAGGTRTIKRT